MTQKEFLELLEKNKNILSKNIYEKLKSEAPTYEEGLMNFLAQRIRETSKKNDAIPEAEKKIVKIFEDASGNLKTKKQELQKKVRGVQQKKEGQEKQKEEETAISLINSI